MFQYAYAVQILLAWQNRSQIGKKIAISATVLCDIVINVTINVWREHLS